MLMDIRTKWQKLGGNEQAVLLGATIGIALVVAIATLSGFGWIAILVIAASAGFVFFIIKFFKTLMSWLSSPTADDSGEHSD